MPITTLYSGRETSNTSITVGKHQITKRQVIRINLDLLLTIVSLNLESLERPRVVSLLGSLNTAPRSPPSPTTRDGDSSDADAGSLRRLLFTSHIHSYETPVIFAHIYGQQTLTASCADERITAAFLLVT